MEDSQELLRPILEPPRVAVDSLELGIGSKQPGDELPGCAVPDAFERDRVGVRPLQHLGIVRRRNLAWWEIERNAIEPWKLQRTVRADRRVDALLRVRIEGQREDLQRHDGIQEHELKRVVDVHRVAPDRGAERIERDDHVELAFLEPDGLQSGGVMRRAGGEQPTAGALRWKQQEHRLGGTKRIGGDVLVAAAPVAEDPLRLVRDIERVEVKAPRKVGIAQRVEIDALLQHRCLAQQRVAVALQRGRCEGGGGQLHPVVDESRHRARRAGIDGDFRQVFAELICQLGKGAVLVEHLEVERHEPVQEVGDEEIRQLLQGLGGRFPLWREIQEPDEPPDTGGADDVDWDAFFEEPEHDARHERHGGRPTAQHDADTWEVGGHGRSVAPRVSTVYTGNAMAAR